MRTHRQRRTVLGLLVVVVAALVAAAISPAVAEAAAGSKAVLSPSSGPIGSAITVRATGFAPDELVTSYFDQHSSDLGHTDDTGAITLRVGVPVESMPGVHQVYVSGRDSGRTVAAPFVVRDNWSQAGGSAERVNGAVRDGGWLTDDNVAGLRPTWSTSVTTGYANAPVVHDGSVYTGTSRGQVVALDQRTGATRWSWPFTPSTVTSPVVGSPAVAEGNVVVALRDGTVRALSVATGGQAWSFSAGSAPRTGVTIAGSTVFAGFSDGRMVALDLHAGATTWTATGTGPVTMLPTLAALTRAVSVVVVTRGAQLSAYDTRTGAARWTTQLAGPATSNPSWSAHRSTLLVSTYRGGLYGLDGRNGRAMWQTPGLSTAFSATTLFDFAWAVRDTGTATEIVIVDLADRGSYESVGFAPAPPSSGLTRVGDLLVFTATDRRVHAVRAFSGSTPFELWSAPADQSAAPVVAVDGTLVLPTGSGTISRFAVV